MACETRIIVCSFFSVTLDKNLLFAKVCRSKVGAWNSNSSIWFVKLKLVRPWSDEFLKHDFVAGAHILFAFFLHYLNKSSFAPFSFITASIKCSLLLSVIAETAAHSQIDVTIFFSILEPWWRITFELKKKCWRLVYKYWVAHSGMGGILSQGKIWTVPFHSASPRLRLVKWNSPNFTER